MKFWFLGLYLFHVSPEIVNHKRIYFSTKTGYTIPKIYDSTFPDNKVCRAVHIQGVVRHGIRNPGFSDIKNINKLLQTIKIEKAKIKTSENSWVLQWNSSYSFEEALLLTKQGELEQYNLAKRIKKRFPAVFNNFYSPTKYKLSETEVSRTSHSASAFAYGLFEGTGFLGSCGYQPVDILSTGKEKDIFLRFFDTCQVYKELHETKKATFKQQQRAFRRSSLYRKVLQEVSTKLNLESMDYKLLKGIYRLCSYRTVHFGELSTWCEFLTVENLYVLEFHEDLKHWWKKSYAYEANYKIAAPLLEDLLNGIIQSANGGKLNAHFRFAHAETIIPLVTLLGLFKDDRSSFYANISLETLRKRNFSSSLVSPFSANALFVLYNCEDNSKYVKFLLNEKEEKLPFCQDLYCPFTEFTQQIQKILNNCNYQYLCTKKQFSIQKAIDALLKFLKFI